MDLVEKYLIEKSPFKIKRKPHKNVPEGKVQYFIRLESIEGGDPTMGYIVIKPEQMPMVQKMAGKKGYVVTKYYEK